VVIAAPTVTAEQRASIDDAIALWSSAGVTAFAIGDTPQVTVEFKTAADAVYGYYDNTLAIVYVNTQVTDPTQRAIVVAHELGHSLGLVHVAPSTRLSVMNPGNLTIDPTADDASALTAIWGSCTP